MGSKPFKLRESDACCSGPVSRNLNLGPVFLGCGPETPKPALEQQCGFLLPNQIRPCNHAGIEFVGPVAKEWSQRGQPTGLIASQVLLTAGGRSRQATIISQDQIRRPAVEDVEKPIRRDFIPQVLKACPFTGARLPVHRTLPAGYEETRHQTQVP
jgi:hypothetical protein